MREMSKREENWASRKIGEAILVLRRNASTDDSMDVVYEAESSNSPKVREALAYVEAWADVADLTVAAFIEEFEHAPEFVPTPAQYALGARRG